MELFYKILMDIMRYVNKTYPDKDTRMVIRPDHSGHFSYMSEIGGEETEYRLFQWGPGYENIFKNFVEFIVEV